MDMVRLAVAAMSGALDAPSVITLSNAISTGYSNNTAGVILHSNGDLSLYYSGVPIVVDQWISPVANVGDYEVRATLSSGDTPTGTIGSWEALSTTRSWTLTNDDTADSCDILLEIRWTGDNLVKDSATYSLFSSSSIEP